MLIVIYKGVPDEEHTDPLPAFGICTCGSTPLLLKLVFINNKNINNNYIVRPSSLILL
jgi:hypothetical protein